MVLDRIAHARHYDVLSPLLARALEYLTSIDWSRRAAGRHELEGDEVFAIVSDYVTRPSDEVPWEAHRKYIDVQYVHTGVERIGYAALETLRSGEYDADRDVIDAEGSGSYVTLVAGAFAVLWPHDAHRPGIAVDAPTAVRKIVIKVSTVGSRDSATERALEPLR